MVCRTGAANMASAGVRSTRRSVVWPQPWAVYARASRLSCGPRWPTGQRRSRRHRSRPAELVAILTAPIPGPLAAPSLTPFRLMGHGHRLAASGLKRSGAPAVRTGHRGLGSDFRVMSWLGDSGGWRPRPASPLARWSRPRSLASIRSLCGLLADDFRLLTWVMHGTERNGTEYS
jgi:hypothetical protein